MVPTTLVVNLVTHVRENEIHIDRWKITNLSSKNNKPRNRTWIAKQKIQNQIENLLFA